MMGIIVISVFLIIGIAYYSLSFFKTWINPVVFFFSPWLLLFSLLSLQLYYFRNLSLGTVIVVLFSFVLFLLGIELFYINREPQPSFSKDSTFADKQKRTLQFFIAIFTLISLIAGMLMLKRLLDAEGDILRIIARAAIIRRKIISGELNIISFYGYFGSLAYLALLLSGIYAGKYGIIRVFSWVSIFPVLLLSFIQMGRAHLLWGVLLYMDAYILVYFVTGKKLFSRRKIIIYTLTFLFLLSIINMAKYFRGGGEILLHYKRYLQVEEPDNMLLRAALSNYVYIVSPVLAFDVMLQDFRSPLVMGGKTFRPLIFFASTSDKKVYYPFVKVPMSVNVYSYLGDAYMDFGYPGFILLPFIFGLVSAYFYHRFIKEPNIIWLSMLSIIYSHLEYSIFYSRFAFGNVWIIIFVLFLIRNWITDGENNI